MTLAAALLAAAPGCQQKRTATLRSAEGGAGETRAAAAPAPAAQKTVAMQWTPPPSPLEATAVARKLIRTGRLSIEVSSYTKAAEQAVRLAEGAKGYLADSQSSRSEHGKLRGTLTLRVPAERFTTVFEALKTLGTVQKESVETQDVTRAYTDLETRLRVKRETGERLGQLLKTGSAKLADVLAVERERARVTEEIESLEGERRFYDQQVAMSTITAELAEPEPIVRSGFLDPLREALSGSLELLGGSIAALIALLVVAIPWVLVLAALWWLWRRLRGRRRRPGFTPPAS